MNSSGSGAKAESRRIAIATNPPQPHGAPIAPDEAPQHAHGRRVAVGERYQHVAAELDDSVRIDDHHFAGTEAWLHAGGVAGGDLEGVLPGGAARRTQELLSGADHGHAAPGGRAPPCCSRSTRIRLKSRKGTRHPSSSASRTARRRSLSSRSPSRT